MIKSDSKDINNVTKRFLAQINAVLLDLKSICRKIWSNTTVFYINNNDSWSSDIY